MPGTGANNPAAAQPMAATFREQAINIQHHRMRAGAAFAGVVLSSLLTTGCVQAPQTLAQVPPPPPPSVLEARRADLQRHDLGVPGREMVQSRIDFPPGVASPRHSHPGEEIVYTIEGRLEYRLEGRPPVTLGAGEVLFIPAGVAHVVTNVGRDNAAELATYFVEKGKPLIVLDR